MRRRQTPTRSKVRKLAMSHSNPFTLTRTNAALRIARSDAAFQRFLDQALGLEGDRV